MRQARFETEAVEQQARDEYEVTCLQELARLLAPDQGFARARVCVCVCVCVMRRRLRAIYVSSGTRVPGPQKACDAFWPAAGAADELAETG